MTLFMVEVRVSDLSRSRAFYAEILGLPVRLEDPVGGFLLLDAGPASIALKAGNLRADGRDALRLVFEVADLDAERSRLIGLGITIGEAAENAVEGYREARLNDPDGTPIRLFAWMRGRTI